MCEELTDTSNNKCAYVVNSGTTACVPRTCDNISSTPTSIDNCKNWLPTCTYIDSKCVLEDVCGNYTPAGVDNTDKSTYCNTILNTDGKKCTYVNDAPKCTARTCANAPTPTSDNDCSGFKIGCTISKEATYKCIENTSVCSDFKGLPTDCQSFTGNNIKCWSAVNASPSTP